MPHMTSEWSLFCQWECTQRGERAGMIFQHSKKLGEAPSLDTPVFVDVKHESLILAIAAPFGVPRLSEMLGDLPKSGEHVQVAWVNRVFPNLLHATVSMLYRTLSFTCAGPSDRREQGPASGETACWAASSLADLLDAYESEETANGNGQQRDA